MYLDSARTGQRCVAATGALGTWRGELVESGSRPGDPVACAADLMVRRIPCLLGVQQIAPGLLLGVAQLSQPAFEVRGLLAKPVQFRSCAAQPGTWPRRRSARPPARGSHRGARRHPARVFAPPRVRGMGGER